MGHLHLDVLAIHADLDFVHNVGDGFHGVRHVALTEFLLGRDQPDAFSEQLALDDCRVSEVSEDTRPHIDDDVLHLRVLVDVAQHLLELGALGDGRCGLPRLDELAGDGDAHLPYFA
nr:hypothetical protein [uncultured Microbacterium sp.]